MTVACLGVGEDGIVVLDAHEQLSWSRSARPLLPTGPRVGCDWNLAGRSFLCDFSTLCYISIASGTSAVNVKTKLMRDEIGLVAEGCVLAKLEDGNNQFSIEEARLIYQQSFHQPCKD